jgi:hypothetical protein
VPDQCECGIRFVVMRPAAPARAQHGATFPDSSSENAPTAGLNDDRTLSRREKVAHPQDEYEAASGIRLQLRLVELSRSQVPRTFDNGDDFIIGCVCARTRNRQDSHLSIHLPFARIAEKVRSLSPSV